MNRRTFIKNTAKAGLVVGFTQIPFDVFSAEGYERLTILHTNDTHSRIDPFPASSKYAGLGGVAKRATLINQIRDENEHVLLLDAGDIFQGTPYFNMYGGELEFKLMSEMKYDAATLGNHDFDAGIEGLVKQLPLTTFPFLNVNYDFNGTPLEGKIESYRVFKKGKMKVGVFGVGIELDGLVPEKLCEGIGYQDPVASANSTAKMLKEIEKCDLVICLSHLGLKYEGNKISDVKLASETENIDIILGGHTHSFLDKPMVVNNLLKEPVVINQVGWAGIILGRLDVYFTKVSGKNDEKITPVINSIKTIVN